MTCRWIRIRNELSYSRDSLALDLMEEFRPILVDTLCLSLFNRKVLSQENFSVPDEADEEDSEETTEERIEDAVRDASDMGAEDAAKSGGIERSKRKFSLILDKCGVSALLAAWSKKMETEFFNRHAGRSMTWGEAVDWQARALKRVIEGTQEAYVPMEMR